MSKYEGKEAVAVIARDDAFDKLADTKALQARLESLPDDRRNQLQGLKFDDDAISLASPVGELRFVAQEKLRPERIVFAADGSPIPLSAIINLSEKSATETGVSVVIDADLPFMLKAMVGSKLKDAVDQISLGIASAISNTDIQ